MTARWLTVARGEAPLIVSIPHAGVDLAEAETDVSSAWIARKDADWWMVELYAFAAALGATIIHTAISRTVIDLNRDPSGASLYPGQVTTGLCPTETFDGERLFRRGAEPDPEAVKRRLEAYHRPYHAALSAEIARLRRLHEAVVVYDAHSIRSRAPRLFEGLLPELNVGSNVGTSCSPRLLTDVHEVVRASGRSFVIDGRFKGGWITRSYGAPAAGIHALQMELACRGYMAEPTEPLSPQNWPPPFDVAAAAPLRATLGAVLSACLNFARS